MKFEFDEKSQLELVASENWSVQDLYSFFHQLNILYNRLYVLDDQIRSKRVRKLRPILYGSLSRVEPGDQLSLDSIEIHSPAEINLQGSGEIIDELGETWKDLKYRNKIEEELLQIELQGSRNKLAHEQNMDALEERAKADEIILRRLKGLKELGFNEEEIRIAMKALIDPLNQLIEVSREKGIATKCD
ncbi:hypothetical protein ACFL3K_00300 [Pseudomonadota bacterium]